MATASTANTAALTEMGLYLVKSLDAIKRQILTIVPNSDGAIVTFKDGTSAPVKITPVLSSHLFCNGTVIVANTKNNVETLIGEWQRALSFEKMTLIFLDEKTGNKWLLRPHIHAKIAEPKTIAQGLLALYEQSLVK